MRLVIITIFVKTERGRLSRWGVERAAADRTTFLITHRLSQIRWADLIIVMRKGQVVAVGGHEQLLSESLAYRNIFARYE